MGIIIWDVDYARSLRGKHVHLAAFLTYKERRELQNEMKKNYLIEDTREPTNAERALALERINMAILKLEETIMETEAKVNTYQNEVDAIPRHSVKGEKKRATNRLAKAEEVLRASREKVNLLRGRIPLLQV